MTMKPGSKDVLWMAFGAAMLLVVMLVVLHVQRGQSPADQLALKAKRVDLVERMRLALASASEAEKSAVMAITDEDSQKYADQARAATAEVDRGGKELGIFCSRMAPQTKSNCSLNSPRSLLTSNVSITTSLSWRSRTPTSKLIVWRLVRPRTRSRKWTLRFPAS